MMKNIGEDQNRIESNGKGKKEDEPQRQSKKKKKSETGQKKMRKKWAIQLTHIMSCKNPWDKET